LHPPLLIENNILAEREASFNNRGEETPAETKVYEDEQRDKNNRQQKITIGPPRLTRFEKTRIVGARALQISMGAPLLIEVPKEVTDPIQIALLELEKKALPITIRRRLPDGSYQDIPLKWLELT
jgi:DNA-directed RNA polymerase I, II, and III subunit RPABC2